MLATQAGDPLMPPLKALPAGDDGLRAQSRAEPRVSPESWSDSPSSLWPGCVRTTLWLAKVAIDEAERLQGNRSRAILRSGQGRRNGICWRVRAADKPEAG